MYIRRYPQSNIIAYAVGPLGGVEGAQPPVGGRGGRSPLAGGWGGGAPP
jgi:hypothetical protein